MLVSENQRSTELTSLTGKGTSLDVIKYSFPQRYADSYVYAMEHFLDVIEGTLATEGVFFFSRDWVSCCQVG